MLLNFVDLQRFKLRAALPARPKSALVFSNYASEDNILTIIRAACAQSNVSLDSLGMGSRNSTSQPESVLPHYDLVFAKGRAALEALAVGNAVVLCDAAGIGPMVTTANMEKLRRLNFGLRALQKPMEAGVLCDEIARYNATDAAQVCAWVRGTAGMDSALDDLLSLYNEVVEEHKRVPASNTPAEMRAASTYLRHWVRNLTAQHEARVQNEHLKIDHQRQKREYAAVTEQYRELQKEQRQLEEKYEQLQAELQRLQSDLAEVFSSSTLRLRNRMVGLPLVGTWLKSLARTVAGRLC